MIPYADTNYLTRLYLELEGAEKARGWAKEAALQAATPLPVSYTHLDVYKRQILL